MQTTVSIIIPAYNAEAFIEETLETIESQLRKPDEVIIIDDGSIDNTYVVANDWLGRHPHIPGKIIRQENQGASAARNTGIENATKDYIAFLDADDLLLPEHLTTLLLGAQACPECVIIFADQEVFSNENILANSFLIDKPVLNLPFESIGNFRVITCPLWSTLIKGNFIPTSTCLVKRTEAINAGGFDTSLSTSEDRHFLLKLSRLGKVGYFKKILARKREHDTNLTHTNNNLNVAKNAVSVIEKLLADAVLYHLTKEELREMQNTLDLAIKNYLYTASRSSFVGYCRAWIELFKSQHYKHLFNIKNLLRAIIIPSF